MNQTQQPDSWSRTNHQILKFTHRWVIDDLKLYLNLTQQNDFSCIKSPKFLPPNDSTLQFSILLYPKGDREASKDHVSIFFKLISCPKPEISIQVKMSIVSANIKHNTIVILEKFKPNGAGWGRTKFMSKEKLYSLQANGKLTIFCEIEAIVDTINTTGGAMANIIEAQLSDNLGRLLKDRKLNDVVLITGNSTVHRAHKVILAARSNVFATKFEQNTGPIDCRIMIKDISGDVIEEMLRFIYTGKVINLNQLADKLLIAAQKYELGLLKDICERSLANNLNTENALTMLVFADEHSVPLLRSKSIEYIKANLSTLISTANWDTLELRPKLYFEIFSQAITENQVKIKELSQPTQWLKSHYFRILSSIGPNWVIYLSTFIFVVGVRVVISFKK